MPPIIAKEDATGVVVGTTNHFTNAFLQVKVELDRGQVVKVHGDVACGDAWCSLLDESRNTKYPCFPRSGLFYLWAVAIGTNPKIMRPSGIEKHSSGGFEWERRRSGVIHMGFGTLWRSAEEKWAGENGILYGHLHIHLLFPTFHITTKSGKEYTIIRNGRLTALSIPKYANSPRSTATRRISCGKIGFRRFLVLPHRDLMTTTRAIRGNGATDSA